VRARNLFFATQHGRARQRQRGFAQPYQDFALAGAIEATTQFEGVHFATRIGL
jgi:hypothetical protein